MDNWLDLYKKLSEPFPEELIQWRAGSVSKDRKRAMALPYAEPRAYEDRLNLICGGDWTVSFAPWSDYRIICNLTIFGVTRASIGESSPKDESPGTSAEAQAFKRACSKFGLGRYIYDIPVPWVAFDDQFKKLLETPKVPKQFLPVPEEELMSKDRAHLLHKELGKLKLIGSHEHKALATEVAQRPISSVTELTEQDARRLLPYAKRLNAERREALEEDVLGAAA